MQISESAVCRATHAQGVSGTCHMFASYTRLRDPRGMVENPASLQVLELFQRVGGFRKELLDSLSRPIVACETQYGYRNKMEFSFSPHEYTVEAPPKRDPNAPKADQTDAEAEKKFVVGLHGPGSYYKVCVGIRAESL